MIAVLQPHIAHYREAFWKGISKRYSVKFFTYRDLNTSIKLNFHSADIDFSHISNLSHKEFLFYNPIPLLGNNVKVLVLMLHFGHFTTWILLLTKFFHRKKVILFGHGISVKRYLEEEKSPSKLLKMMIYLSDGVWLYTEKERQMWLNVFPDKKITSLNNTISDVVTPCVEYDVDVLKNQFNIKEQIVLIFCARFNNEHRRIDLLLESIRSFDSSKFGFIIIGDGVFKPDFSSYKNVYDFGSVYDIKLKSQLFCISDIYFQPGWVGLSIVEAMKYGKPIFTFQRSEETLQCVEYFYIKDGYNGKIFADLDSFVRYTSAVTKSELLILSRNALSYSDKNLSMIEMVKNGLDSLSSFTGP